VNGASAFRAAKCGRNLGCNGAQPCQVRIGKFLPILDDFAIEINASPSATAQRCEPIQFYFPRAVFEISGRRRMKSLAAVKINMQLKIISLVRHRHSACALLF
jgi:hypothetical protein